jgi:hypothetical protein
MLEVTMRTNLAMLAVLAGAGVSIAAVAVAEPRNLSCITDISPNEQRLLRDCEPKTEEIYYAIEVLNQLPPPPPPPITIKNGESGKGGGVRGERDHDAPTGGGDPGGPHGAAN